MSAPLVVAVAPGSPAERAGIGAGDEVVALNGRVPRDVIEWRLLADEADLEVELRRGGLDVTIEVAKREGEALGAEVSSALFDQVRTCDNHCAFCFIYQLPPGMRSSLYLKDDDYRLSFLYGNFTTLTRFTEADLERVVTEGLSPLHVSIHATDPDIRSEMLRNRRGATSLRWLRALLDHGVAVHGQVVCCPGINDGAVLDDTLCGVLDRYPELASLCVVPLGVSRFNHEPTMRPHTRAEADAVVECVERWQDTFLHVLGRRLVFAADEYYLLAGRPFPEPDTYEGFPMHEDGVGMARTFELEFRRSGHDADRRAERLLRLGRRRAGRGLPGAPHRRLRHRDARAAARPSGSSPASTAPRSSPPSSTTSAGPTSASSRCATSSSAAPPRSPACWSAPTSPGSWPTSPKATATCCPTSASPRDASSTASPSPICPRPVEVLATDGIALRRALEASAA